MGLDEFESIMRQAAWSLEVEGQHPDAQTMEWCRQMLAGEISLEEYLDLVIRRATEYELNASVSDNPDRKLSSEERSALAEHMRDALTALCQQMIDSYFTS